MLGKESVGSSSDSEQVVREGSRRTQVEECVGGFRKHPDGYERLRRTGRRLACHVWAAAVFVGWGRAMSGTLD